MIDSKKKRMLENTLLTELDFVVHKKRNLKRRIKNAKRKTY